MKYSCRHPHPPSLTSSASDWPQVYNSLLWVLESLETLSKSIATPFSVVMILCIGVEVLDDDQYLLTQGTNIHTYTAARVPSIDVGYFQTDHP